jgi:hypothetical protein
MLLPIANSLPMRDQHLGSEPPLGPATLDDDLVREQLARMLRSSLFSQSRRYAPLLRFVVEETLEGRGSLLKERLVGVHVFQRDPGYDTAADPIVRVTVAEIRKRLAQYYLDDEHRHELRIELPAGHYAASFRDRQGPEQDSEEEVTRRDAATVQRTEPELRAFAERQGVADTALVSAGPVVKARRLGEASRSMWVPLLTALIVSAGLAALLWSRVRPRSGEDDLWSMLSVPGRQVTICLPTDAGKHHGALTQAEFLAGAGKGEPGSPLSAQNQTFLEHETQGENVVFSDAVASIRIASVLARRSQEFHVRLNTATTLDDLRQGPAVLIGGLDNQWSLQALGPLRFGFAGSDDKGYWISDALHPGYRQWSLDLKQPYTAVTRDYALIALVHSEQAGQPQLVVAGIGMSGTMAAGEFLADPAKLAALSTALGSGLRERSFEVVLSTDVVRGISGAPKIEAVWESR